MAKILKSDLTYSLGGGFLLGTLMLFFMQPLDQRQALEQTLSSTVSSATQLLG